MADRGYGKKIRALRHREGLTQSALAQRLEVSPSYLNLLENDRRPLTTALLLKLAQCFDLDLKYFGNSDEEHLTADVMEVFGDAVFDDHPLTTRDVTEFVASNPDVARAVVRLHQAYTHSRVSAETMAQRVLDDQDTLGSVERSRLSSEQVSDLVQRHGNYFSELEEGAETLWRQVNLQRDDLYPGLIRYLKQTYDITVNIVSPQLMRGAVRRFDPHRRELRLSEALHTGSRVFQLAVQIGILSQRHVLDRIVSDPLLTSEEARALGRVTLAGYFAGAVVMPYTAFLSAAEEVRYDVEVLGQRFRASFEQICHRLTTLRRPGQEGVRFYFVRVDMAGNITKKFSGAGIWFPRFSGLCALWNVHAAFLQPGVVRVQISKQLDGTTVFAIARTVRRHVGTYHSPTVLYAVGIGCALTEAHRLVYGDGIDLTNPNMAVPIGISCRLCERTSCEARAFPSLHRPMHVDENVRGVSSFSSPEE